MTIDGTIEGPALQGGAAVLGSAEIDGVGLTRRQRAIVATLVLNRHRPVTTDELIDAVWGESVPATARQSLQNQITRLRRRFGTEVIRTGPAGYVLDRASDVAAFERTVGAWLRRPAEVAAITPLSRSLELWRGDPYADLDDHPDIGPERVRLVELRRQAEEHLAVCRILAGDVGRATSGLATLAEEDPCRERTWGLLIVALHQDGRDAEAIDVCRRAERRLRSLGLVPSTDLAQMHTALSRGEPIDSPLMRELVYPPAGRRSRCTHRALRSNRRCDERSAS